MLRTVKIASKEFRISALVAAAALVLTGCSTGDSESSDGASSASQSSALWVLNAAFGSIADVGEDFTIELVNVQSVVNQFTDRPERRSDYPLTSDFIDHWSGEFGDIAPNASLTFIGGDESAREAIAFVISEPVFDATKSSLSLKAQLLDTSAPFTPGNIRDISLFIDDGCPDFDMSLACMPPLPQQQPGYVPPPLPAPSPLPANTYTGPYSCQWMCPPPLTPNPSQQTPPNCNIMFGCGNA